MARVKTSGVWTKESLKNVTIVEDNSEQVEEGIKRALRAALEEVGLVAERFAKLMTPVDTGRLRNSITHRISSGGTEVYIGTNLPYAPYIELGVSTWNGQGPKKAPKGGYQMLRKAASEHGDLYDKIIEKHLKNA